MPYGPNGGYYEWGFPPNRFRPPVSGGAYEQMVFFINNRARAELGIPGMFVMGRDGSLSLSPSYTNMVGYALQANLANMVIKVVAQAKEVTIDSMYLLAQALTLDSNSQHIERANKQLAAEMRKALVAGYGQSVEKRKQVPSYARSNRLSGKLRTAISQPDMAVGTASGINYINKDRLNAEARHWARINFGVQGAPGARRGAARSPAPEQFTLLTSGRGGRSAGTVGFKSKPRPPMYLPPGFWMFIGGSASAATVRTKKPQDDDVEDDRAARAAARAAARRAKADAAVAGVGGKAAASTPTAQFGNVSPYFSRRLNKQSGISSWGADVGGYARTRTYQRNYRIGAKNSPAPGNKKRTVTATIRGIRRSRQGFNPTRRGPWYPTAGVVATNFMDTGFRALAKNVDRVYFQMADDIVEEAKATAAGQALRKTMITHKVTFKALGGIDQPKDYIKPKSQGRGHGPSTS